ncbi:lipopolysaccharide transport system ATP-binding protein [Flavobacterium sp. 90]|uniref:ABC transporter ATP-binding protein n=1 Tax=unclassified Flavobacterium TaxID=196869 RepID=UPI000EB49CC2|nr:MULTISPECIES: ABC transporter ATP-binding protein [unclassified Flavobacterium]RKR10931.1 lipopolysaccharide transport system ATP-binding protein [Flavobacterium sp. 81]TCK54715.1 lipopolysaccharide transport system ATP-binding protein [Flavobacterium sp. 90]
MEKDIILKAENISKQYRLGQVGTGTLSHDLNRWWHQVRGKENPYLKIGDINDRSTKGTSDYVWALQDINFEVERGEVLGIIGKNGAGKSTLLKILSKVTAPTTGSIKSRGRIASLLEVGTGFHGEMTGRENIFLNGAILGMTKKEITSKLEEIIEFSGCERYIDTPVKRYSSGMTVRLAFAVAAFLEPEVLVVDEVLAVGDAEFQKKAIGKMQDISREGGRTVLFVSHNMAAIETLCTRVISMNNGSIFENGAPTKVISNYLQSSSFSERKISYDSLSDAKGNENIRIMYAAIENASSIDVNDIIDVTSSINFRLKIVNTTEKERISVGFDLRTIKGDIVFGSANKFDCSIGKVVEINCQIPANFMNDDVYQIHCYFHTNEMQSLFFDQELLTFEVKDVKRDSGYLGKINGFIRPSLPWTIKNEI